LLSHPRKLVVQQGEAVMKERSVIRMSEKLQGKKKEVLERGN